MTATHPKSASPHRVCPTCGELMQSSRCSECAPSEPARAYNERVTQPITGPSPGIALAIASSVDARRAASEWVTGPDDRDPQTRRAHPTLVRSALAEAEERARDRVARSALVGRVQTTTKPRYSGTTSPRLRPVTPLPPAPTFEPPAVAPPELIAERPATSVAPPPEPGLVAARADLAAARPSIEALLLPPAPRPDELVPAPPPEIDPLALPGIEAERRRVRVFWMALLGGFAVLLVLAAI